MREIRLHDSLTNSLQPLRLRDPGKVGIYACGPTVYSRVHVGNARPYVIFALLKRFLEHEGLSVALVENVTDVNDKIYAAATEAGVASAELAREMTAHYVADTDLLDLGRPDHEPKAAETIDGIVDLIGDLVDAGHAYAAGGDVYFDVASFADYGRLSNRPAQEMDQPEADDDVALKRSPRDFALWKATKPDEDTSWPSPWGEGRPGWHIECSAMAEALLGTDFEIHGGGSDLTFPHHENEIAQTQAARGQPLARIWMHNGMVRTGADKMAKSVGNIFLLHNAIERFGRDVVVWYFSSGHYRQPVGFSEEAMAEQSQSLQRVRELCRRLDPEAPEPAGQAAYVGRLFDALAEDFNLPAARAVLAEWISEANRRLDAGETVGRGRIAEMLHAFGLEGVLTEEREVEGPAQQLLAERERARTERDFARADELRDELAALGYEVRDTPDGGRLVPLPT